jgi:hypothetical protein
VELDYIFGVYNGQTPTPEEERLSMEMQRLWAEFATGRRKLLLPTSPDAADGAAGASDLVIVDAAPHYVGALHPDATAAAAAAAAAGDGSAASGSELRREPQQLHMEDWPLYDNLTQRCMVIDGAGFHPSERCRPAACALWMQTLKHGLVRVPPQNAEPLVSLIGNVWVPRALIALVNHSVHIAAAVVLLVVAVVASRIRRHKAVAAAAAAGPVGGSAGAPPNQASANEDATVASSAPATWLRRVRSTAQRMLSSTRAAAVVAGEAVRAAEKTLAAASPAALLRPQAPLPSPRRVALLRSPRGMHRPPRRRRSDPAVQAPIDGDHRSFSALASAPRAHAALSQPAEDPGASGGSDSGAVVAVHIPRPVASAADLLALKARQSASPQAVRGLAFVSGAPRPVLLRQGPRIGAPGK